MRLTSMTLTFILSFLMKGQETARDPSRTVVQSITLYIETKPFLMKIFLCDTPSEISNTVFF